MVAIAFRRLPQLPALLSLGLALTRLAGLGLVAIGISGGIAFAAGTLFGKDFVSGDRAGVTYTPDRCAELLEYYPGRSCEEAATAHHFDEMVTIRPAAGLLGLLVLGAERLLVPGSMRRKAPPLPPGIIEAAGATAFGLAAGGLLGLGLSQMFVMDPRPMLVVSGAGMWLSGGLVAAPIAAFYGIRVLALVSAQAGSTARTPSGL